MYAKLTDALMSKGARYEKEGNRIYIGEIGVIHILDDTIRFQGLVLENEPYYIVIRSRYGMNERKIVIPKECIVYDSLRYDSYENAVIYSFELRNIIYNGVEYRRAGISIIIDPPVKERIKKYGRKAYEFYREHPEEVKTAMKIGAMLLL